MGEREIPFEVNTTGGLPVLSALACPYPELAKLDRSVCTMEKMMLSEILGENVRLSECRLDGATCCTFTPSCVIGDNGVDSSDIDGEPWHTTAICTGNKT